MWGETELGRNGYRIGPAATTLKNDERKRQRQEQKNTTKKRMMKGRLVRPGTDGGGFVTDKEERDH